MTSVENQIAAHSGFERWQKAVCRRL